MHVPQAQSSKSIIVTSYNPISQHHDLDFASVSIFLDLNNNDSGRDDSDKDDHDQDYKNEQER